MASQFSSDKIRSPIFIVGMPRSGTTLLTSILSAHPNIAIAPETHYLCYWVRQYKALDISSPQDFERFWQAISHSERFSYFGIDADKTRSRILAKGSLCHQHILSGWLEEYAYTINKLRWGEKTPLHYQHLEQLLSWFPNARIIWMLRDPRAVTASLQQVPWASRYIHVHAQQWQDSIVKFEKMWRDDDRIMLLQYEHLVQQPEKYLRELCNFLGENYVPDSLNNRSEAHTPIINRQGWASAHLQSALQPVSTHAIDKWRHTLTNYQIEMIDSLTFPKAADYGYGSNSASVLSISARLALNLEVLGVKLERKFTHWQTKLTRHPKQSGKHIGAFPKQ